MLLFLAAVIFGLILLAWSADRFILGAAQLARILGAPPLIIGIVVVGIGTSAPEVMVSISASFSGAPNLAVGNALGSNITNIGLVLGLTALLSPLAVSSGVLRRELPLVIGVSFVALAMMWDLQLARWEGILLLLGFLGVLGWMMHLGRSSADDPLVQEIAAHEEQEVFMSTKRAWMWVAVGLILLPLSAQVLVWGASNIAQVYGVSDLVIGLTIVAIGTSLPELAAALASARRNEADLALGNVLGSNLFNLLLVLGVPAAIATPALEAETLTRDLPMMLGLTVATFVMAWGWRGQPGQISRLEGAALLVAFVGYELILASAVNLI